MGFSRQIARKLMMPALLLVLSGCSSFELTSQPPADVYENGRKIGVTPYSFTLISGFRSFTVKHDGYVDQDVRIASVDSRQTHVNLQWIGQTRVDTIPEGAEVIRLADNRVLGVTPCSLHLSRSVEVTFRLEGFRPIERQLIPNREYDVELHPTHGFKPVLYRDILFTSDQGPVSIYDRVAGERIGITPARLKVELGSELEYRLPGYASGYALISRNDPQRIDITLQPRMRITLEGTPGASVYRVGESISLGQMPLVVVVEGPELYEVKKVGCYDQTVAVTPASASRIAVELEEIPYKTIFSDPPGADVYRLGGLEKLGTAPFTTIVSGECVFEIRKAGYQTLVIGAGPSSPCQLSVSLIPVPPDEPDAAAIGALDSPAVDSF